jgi:DNA-directed RNA polymerase specialized sigma24 family protein
VNPSDEQQREAIAATRVIIPWLWRKFRVSRAVAEDLMQDALVALLLEFRKTEEWPRNVEAWLRKVAERKCLDWFRRFDNKATSESLPEDRYTVVFELVALTKAEILSIVDCIEHRLGLLERKDARSAHMVATFRHYVDGASIEEVMTLNGNSSKNAASQYKFHCLAEIRKWLAPCAEGLSTGSRPARGGTP